MKALDFVRERTREVRAVDYADNKGGWSSVKSIIIDSTPPQLLYYTTTDDRYSLSDANMYYAQTFTVGTVGPNENHNITKVKLKLFRVGSPGTITVSIRATDGSGLPTGSDLSTGTIDGNTLTTDNTGEWYEIEMSSYTLQASTKYAIIMRATNPGASSGVGYREDSTVPTYSGGIAISSSNSGSTWTKRSDFDIMFEIWGSPA